MTVTADIGSTQGGDFPYTWEISYDDVTKRVTAEGSGTRSDVLVSVQITTAGAVSQVAFVQPGDTTTFPGADFRVTMGAGPTLIGPTIQPAAVARLVGKIGTITGGLPFTEESVRVG
jgi:hypothetical protein